MRHEFHPEALEEYERAALWYAERDPELAERFVESVEEAIQRILEGPQQRRRVYEDVRRCLTRIFPYGILYTIEPEFVLILAVMHTSRKPGYWKNRMTP
jgi:plasmid stabilization system protein ParE